MSETEYVGRIDLPGTNSMLPEEFKDRPYIRVYLASALTGREEEKGSDNEVRGAICEVLSKASVQGEAYVIRYEVYNPAEHTSPGTTHPCEEVYLIDFKELVASDFALFYLNAGSLGMGIERQIAAMGGMPAAWICPKKEQVSRMFQGAFGGSLFSVEFDVVDELSLKLGNAIAQYGSEIFAKARRRREIIRQLQCQEIPKRIFRKRVSLNITNRQLARETGIQPFWWEQLQRDGSGLLAATTFTPIIFFQNAEILEGRWEISESGFPFFHVESDLGQAQKTSLDNLYDAYISRPERVDDDVLLGMWAEYHWHAGQTGDTLWKNGEVVSKEEWLRRIGECEKNTVIRVVQLDSAQLPDTHRRSLDSLYVFLGHPKRISDENLRRLWRHFKKDIEEKEAARGEDKSKLGPYSVEDWRNLFNRLHFHD